MANWIESKKDLRGLRCKFGISNSLGGLKIEEPSSQVLRFIAFSCDVCTLSLARHVLEDTSYQIRPKIHAGDASLLLSEYKPELTWKSRTCLCHYRGIRGPCSMLEIALWFAWPRDLWRLCLNSLLCSDAFDLIRARACVGASIYFFTVLYLHEGGVAWPRPGQGLATWLRSGELT